MTKKQHKELAKNMAKGLVDNNTELELKGKTKNGIEIIVTFRGLVEKKGGYHALSLDIEASHSNKVKGDFHYSKLGLPVPVNYLSDFTPIDPNPKPAKDDKKKANGNSGKEQNGKTPNKSPVGKPVAKPAMPVR